MRWPLGVLGLTLALLVPGSSVTTAAVVVVKNSHANMAIVTGSVELPAAELQRYLKRISGAKLALVPAVEGAKGVYVGLVRDFPWLELKGAAQLGAEGFLLQTDAHNLYLVAQEPAGVQHAVTTFLHRIGCRWFFPGEVWEVVPHHATIAGDWNERQTPSFSIQRRIWPGYGAYAKNRRDWDDWNRHNRMGAAIPIKIHHSFNGLDPRGGDFERHPEWFALVDGRRQPTKPCYSHPQVIARAIAHAQQQAADGAGMVTMSAPDGLGFCECQRCAAVLDGTKPLTAEATAAVVDSGRRPSIDGVLRPGDDRFTSPGKGYDRSRYGVRPDGTVVCVTSETLFALVNRVAAAVAVKHPEVRIGCYAYSAYSHPPSFKLKPNVYVQTTTQYRRTPLSLARQLEAFGEKTNMLGIREYYSVYQWDWDGPDPGGVRPDRLQNSLRFFRSHGVTAINAEASNNWGPRGLGYYLASQLLWNVDADVSALVDDFYRQAFGPAAEPIERYYTRWYGASVEVLGKSSQASADANNPPTSQTDVPRRLSAETLSASYRDLDRASQMARGHPHVQRRVDHLRMYAHFLLARIQLEQATARQDRAGILAGIEAETVFGGRLSDTNMVHARPLVGKAFPRRFRKYSDLLASLPEDLRDGGTWRHVGTPPTHAELERIWAADKKLLEIE